MKIYLKSFVSVLLWGVIGLGLMTGWSLTNLFKTTAKDILEDGNTVTIFFDVPEAPFKITYKKQNGDFYIVECLWEGEDMKTAAAASCSAEIKGGKIFEFKWKKLFSCTIDTENNTYTLTTVDEGFFWDTTKDGKELISFFKCLVNDKDIVPTLTYKPYVD